MGAALSDAKCLPRTPKKEKKSIHHEVRSLSSIVVSPDYFYVRSDIMRVLNTYWVLFACGLWSVTNESKGTV